MRYVVTRSLFRSLRSVNTNHNEVNKMRSVDQMGPFAVQYTDILRLLLWKTCEGNLEVLYWAPAYWYYGHTKYIHLLIISWNDNDLIAYATSFKLQTANFRIATSKVLWKQAGYRFYLEDFNVIWTAVLQ
jgi:hypothetical protein